MKLAQIFYLRFFQVIVKEEVLDIVDLLAEALFMGEKPFFFKLQ